MTVTELGISAPVYNLTVQDNHQYFANGILVANCDSLLYIHNHCRHLWYRAPQPVVPEPERFLQGILQGDRRQQALLTQPALKLNPYGPARSKTYR